MVFLGLVAFAILTWIIGRRRGIDVINRRVYGNRYSEAAGARRDPPRAEAPGLLDRPFWARVPRSRRG